MQRFLWFLALIAAAGCGSDDDPADFLEEIRAADYRSFDRAPGYSSRTVSTAPHGGNVEIFVDPTVASALAATSGSIVAWPDGSLIVKEGFNASGTLVILAAMEKRGSGWYWAEWNQPSDDVVAAGDAISTCENCHSAGSDLVRAFTFP